MNGSVVHVCRAPGFSFRTYRYCRWCDRRRRHVLIDHVWWGAEHVCCWCGVRTDTEFGEKERPKVGVDRTPLIQMWRDAMPKREYHDAVAEYLGIEP